MLSYSESDTDTEETKTIAKTKKRKSHGRVTDVMKKMRLQSHELGPDCCCARLKCFSEVSAEERSVNISHFNKLQSVNEQNSLLTGLINVVPVSRRRSRKPEEEAKKHDGAYAYKNGLYDSPATVTAKLTVGRDYSSSTRKVSSVTAV
ncbi:hypothetical protein J6590_074799 [Homalodisca vitripennis]|nr:hypothetical protein J6590_074799 [Homalodisca vitripennis]